MPRYINGDALIARIRRYKERVKCDDEFLDKVYGMAHEHIIEIIEDEFPAADVEEVRHGEWINEYFLNDKWYHTCSNCNTEILVTFFDARCPKCGAKMDGKRG